MLEFDESRESDSPNASAATPERVRSRTGSRLRWWGVLLMLLALAALAWATWKYVVQPRVFGSPPSRPAAAIGMLELRVAPPGMGK